MPVPTIQSYQPYPTPVPNNQQVVIPQITMPVMQPFPQSYPAQGTMANRLDGAQSSMIPGPQLTRVKGLDGAKAFATQPNAMYALFDEDDDIMYVKVTDGNNYPVSLKRYRFVEEEEPAPEAPPEYVTKEEFTELSERLNDLSQKLEAVL